MKQQKTGSSSALIGAIKTRFFVRLPIILYITEKVNWPLLNGRHHILSTAVLTQSIGTDCHYRIFNPEDSSAGQCVSAGRRAAAWWRLWALWRLSEAAEWLCLYLFHASLCACWLPWCTALSQCFHLKGGWVFPQKTQLHSVFALWNLGQKEIGFISTFLFRCRSVLVLGFLTRFFPFCWWNDVWRLSGQRRTAAWSHFIRITHVVTTCLFASQKGLSDG